MLFSPGVLVKGSASSYDIIYCLAITDLQYSELKTGLPWPRAKGFQGWHMEVAGQASLFLFPPVLHARTGLVSSHRFCVSWEGKHRKGGKIDPCSNCFKPGLCMQMPDVI